MIDETKWNEFEEIYKNNLLILNLFFIFFHFFFCSTFSLYFISITFFLVTKHNKMINHLLQKHVLFSVEFSQSTEQDFLFIFIFFQMIVRDQNPLVSNVPHKRYTVHHRS